MRLDTYLKSITMLVDAPEAHSPFTKSQLVEHLAQESLRLRMSAHELRLLSPIAPPEERAMMISNAETFGEYATHCHSEATRLNAQLVVRPYVTPAEEV